MVIECSSCNARFKLADDKIKESGTKVRCTKCREVFTVFPEIPPPIAPPVIPPALISPVAPVSMPQKVLVDDFSFSESDTSPLTNEMPPPAFDVPVSQEDNWNQETETDFFSDEFAGEAGASDFDAISFDNIETPVFTKTDVQESTFGFPDDTAFSFSDISLADKTEQTDKISDVPDDQSLSTENETGFDADFDLDVPSQASTEELSQFNVDKMDEKFTFSESENISDFSWEEPVSSSFESTSPEETQENETPQEDTAFDFSSFSFDDVDVSVASDENNNAETIQQSEEKIELSMETETVPTPIRTTLPPLESPDFPVIRDRPESTPRPTRPLRPRTRKKKANSNRFPIKIIIVILVGLGAYFGFMNRVQIQRWYKNSVSGFIENQSRIETNGNIGLVKLSGSYVHNDQEGDFFVINGEAVNEFKGVRSSILVRGTIYSDNGTILQSQSAYCGNPLKENSLKKLSFNEIKNKMSNELGENLVNLNIASEKKIPFTIVFNKAPKNIKEFTVEVLESKPGIK